MRLWRASFLSSPLPAPRAHAPAVDGLHITTTAGSRRLAQAGAVIVSGSQAHQPQAFEFEQGALIHYGLGNLFFDQYDVSPATRQAFIDRHIFYDGRYLGTELLTYELEDYSRPRPMTAGARFPNRCCAMSRPGRRCHGSASTARSTPASIRTSRWSAACGWTGGTVGSEDPLFPCGA